MANISERGGGANIISFITATIIIGGPNRFTDGGMLSNNEQCDGPASGMDIYPTVDGSTTGEMVKGVRESDVGAAVEVRMVPGEGSPRIIVASTRKPRSDSFSSNTSKPKGREAAGRGASSGGSS